MGDQPLLAHVFETLVGLGIDELVVVVGYRGDQIREHFGDAVAGVPIRYVTQPERRGLADAIACAAPALSGDVLVLNGDNVCEANLATAVDCHRETEAVATVPVERVSRDRAGQGGVFDVDENDEVVGVVEKPAEPPSRLIPRGFYAIDQRVVAACEDVQPGPTGECELAAALDALLASGHAVEPVPLEGWCINVNTPADRDRAEAKLAASDD